jgi:hypothetical protein
VTVDGGSANASLSLAQPARSSKVSWHALVRPLVYSVSCVSESTVFFLVFLVFNKWVGELVRVSMCGGRRLGG